MKKSIQKQYLKRITACVLIFIFSLMCISANAADEVYTKQELDKFDENVRLLSAFGLTDKDRAAATTIKRGDFAAIMLKYLGYDESFYSGGTTFSDVPDEKSPIYGMEQLGLLHGYPDGTFHPDDDVLIEQAVKVMVSALGYEPMAEMRGGYPNGYMSYASSLELLDGTTTQPESTLTYYNLVHMMVNALSVKLVKTEADGSLSVSRDTWFSSRLDVEKYTGIVTAADRISINETNSNWENSLVINGIVYPVSEDYSNLLGCNTEFYVNSKGEIVYITEKSNKRMEFDADDVVSYKDKTYTIENENGREKKYKLAQDSYIVFNGASADSISESDMCPKYGKVTLIDNNNDGKYEAVLIESFDIYVVKSIDKDNQLIYCKNGAKSTLDFGGYGDNELTVYNKSGKELDFEQITTDSVIRVAVAKNNEKAKIIVSADSVTGSVTKVAKDKVYIDNTPYDVIDELIDISSISAGRKGTFYLDSEGMLAAISEGDNSYSYGYLLNAYMTDNKVDMEIKVLDVQGNRKEIKVAKKVNIDGLKSQKAEQVLNLLKKGTETVERRVIRYKCNGDGEVREIDTPYNSPSDLSAKPQNGESEESLRLIYSGTTEYTKQLHNFMGKVNVDSDTLVFVVTGDKDDDYKIKRISEIPADTKFKFEAYSDDENEFYAKILFSDDKTVKNGGGDGEVIGVVASVEDSINEDDEPVTKILFKSKLFEKELLMKEELANSFPYNAAEEPTHKLEVGDMVTLQYSGDEASDVALVYKPSENLFPGGNKYGQLTETRIHYMYGYVYSIEKGFVNITQKDVATEGAPNLEEVESFSLSDFVKILRYTDTRDGKGIVQATSADLVDYKTAGDNCSKVFISVEWEYPNLMVIYDE